MKCYNLVTVTNLTKKSRIITTNIEISYETQFCYSKDGEYVLGQR